MRIRAVAFLLLISAISAMAEVDEGTGRMVLNERLATISGNTISFNLDLQYSSGIAVNQPASWVGLGFDITLPYVERLPNGSADEKEGSNPACIGKYDNVKNYNKLLLSSGHGYNETPELADYTSQQDIYTLSASFANGSIIFCPLFSAGPKMKPYLQQWRAVDIDYEIVTTDGDPNITKWVFIDENGVKYIFAQAVRIGTKTDGNRVPHTVNKHGKNGAWIEWGDLWGDGYANDYYNYRWYLTEIQAPGYTPGAADGYIRIEYTPEQTPVQLFDASSFSITVNNEMKRAVLSGPPLRSIFRYTELADEYTVLSYAPPKHVRMLYPIYPVRIYSAHESAVFLRSESDDLNYQGKERIDEISLYAGDILQKKVRFDYDASGLALNHPYAGVGKGRLKLNGLSIISSNGTVQPLVSFEYAANPAIQYTYNSSSKITVNGYPLG